MTEEFKEWTDEFAKGLNIKVEDCHLGHFDLDMLGKAYRILIMKG